jgi:hypothetical protein
VIDDITAPVPTLATLANVTAECSVASLTAPTATDNCAGVVTVTNNATLPITTQGTTVVTWTYDDGNGNIIDYGTGSLSRYIEELYFAAPDQYYESLSSFSGNTHVGNILYAQGVIIITNQDYKNAFPVSP